MPNRLSHSSLMKFQECPKAWEYHYVQKLRSKYQKAALLFGTSIDQAFTAMLRNESAEDTFKTSWEAQEINKIKTSLRKCTDIVYAIADYDKDLLLEEDLDLLKAEFNITDPVEDVDKIYKIKEKIGYDLLSKDKKQLLNYANWLCLYRKGLILLKTLRKDFLPNILEVYSTQDFVELNNADGDKIIGYSDMVVKYKGYDKPVIFDLKTSSKRYEPDAVLTSPQLTLYVHALSEKYQNTRYAGFVVLSKHIKKNKVKKCKSCNHDLSGTRFETCNKIINKVRCEGEIFQTIDPEGSLEVLVNEIPERTETIVMDNVDFINKAIHTGNFHRNLSSCVNKYGKCQFYNLCYKNQDKDLIKVE